MNRKKRLPETLLAIRGDIFGGLTAAVVALPLALAFGVASGAGAISGLYGAILVGFFAALFGGTPTQVSGPTGPMTVVMTTIIMQYAHQPSLAFVVVIIGGIIQIVMGKIGWGKFVAYMPYPLISGFMSGIGCIIIILQIPAFLGHPAVKDGLHNLVCNFIPSKKNTLGYPTSIDRINSRQFRWLFVFVWRTNNW